MYNLYTKSKNHKKISKSYNPKTQSRPNMVVINFYSYKLYNKVKYSIYYINILYCIIIY